MKIAFYAPLKPPDHPNPSGDRLLARLFIQALEAAGHEVILASSFRSFERAGSTQAQLAIQAAGVTEREALIQRFQQESPPDLWFSYHIYHRAPDWIGPEVAAYFKIPYVVAEASVSPKHANGPWQQGYLRGRQCIRYADAMVSINPRDLECAAPLLRRETPLLRLKPFIDTSGFPRARTHEATTPLRLVSVAMMRPGDKQASWFELGDILSGLESHDWTLEVIGDGRARDKIEAKLRDACGHRLQLHGRVEGEALCSRLAQADLFVWPGINEAFGMAYLEAQCVGLPVVAGRYGGVSGVVYHGQSGLLYPAGDITSARTCIHYLTRRPRLLGQMAKAAAETVRREHDLFSASQKLNQLFTGLSRSKDAIA